MPESSSHGEAGSNREEDFESEGLLGTLSQDEISRALRPKMGAFLECFTDRYRSVEFLSGAIQLVFRVSVEGRVRWVYPAVSDIGDRVAERCLLERARRVHFSRPRGGEAEFSLPLAIDPQEEIRPPFPWNEARLSGVISEHSAALVSHCGPDLVAPIWRITVYVSPGGELLAAGASAANVDAAAKIDCVIDSIQAWPMPDPGSYPAKVSFTLQ